MNSTTPTAADDPQELRRLVKAAQAAGTPLFSPLRKVEATPEPTAPPPAPPAPPVLKKSAPPPNQHELLERVRECMPQLMREWTKKTISIDVPLMKSAPFMDLEIRAKKLGLMPMIRYELDELAPLRFAKAVLDMQLVNPDDMARSRSQLFKAAVESTRCTFALRDARLVPSLAKFVGIFEPHDADVMSDRNFASLNEVFEWLDRAESPSASLAKRDMTPACTNRSFLACPA